MALVGCSRSDVSPPLAFNATGAPTVEISVPDMMCEDSCAVKAKEILSEIPGAREVIVDFDAKTATVAIDEGEFDADAAVAALVDHSFVHSTLKGGAANSVAVPAEDASARPHAAPVH